jgi:hypothetical protein
MRAKIQIASWIGEVLWFVSFETVVAMQVSGQVKQGSAQATSSSHAAQQSADKQRFPVALQHSGSWCYGYLYVGQDKVRFEVVAIGSVLCVDAGVGW